MLRPFLRTAVALLARTFLWMTFSAVILLGALKYGPTLFAQAVPEDLRPAPEDVADMSPQKIMDALKEIRGALE
jgi:hypothetical protein